MKDVRLVQNKISEKELKLELDRITELMENLPHEERELAYCYTWGVFIGVIQTINEPLAKFYLTPNMVLEALGTGLKQYQKPYKHLYKHHSYNLRVTKK